MTKLDEQRVSCEQHIATSSDTSTRCTRPRNTGHRWSVTRMFRSWNASWKAGGRTAVHSPHPEIREQEFDRALKKATGREP
jgi:hypothetical protein